MTARPSGPIRALIVDDCGPWARSLTAELEQAGDIHAVCIEGELGQLRAQLLQFHPEVIVLDLGLRQASPLELLSKLRAYYPVPVIVSASADQAARAIQAMQRGALEAVRKPDHGTQDLLRAFASGLAAKIRLAACMARPVPLRPQGAARLSSFRAAGLEPGDYLVAIGASTGGTNAIETLLRRVPADWPPTVMVQHMPAGFTGSFAGRLNSLSAIQVREAEEGQVVRPGQAVIARGDTHLVVRRAGRQWCVRYTDQRLVNCHCPSVDVLMDSVATAAGARGVGILLTGMGEDGARGLLKMRQAGAITMAQDQASCVVYGMPKAAVEMGAVAVTAPPQDMPALVLQALVQRGPQSARPPGYPWAKPGRITPDPIPPAPRVG